MSQYISKCNFCLTENAAHLYYKQGTLQAIQQNTLRLLRESQGFSIKLCALYIFTCPLNG
jgi:hypothetical protein